MNRVSISELLGAVVRGPDGHRLGTVRDVCLDHGKGRAEAVHLAVPLAAGGHGDVRIPWSQFQIRPDGTGDQSVDIRLSVRLETLRQFARRQP